MSILLPDGTYRLYRQQPRADRTGFPVPSYPTYPDAPDWTGEGLAVTQADKTWQVTLDPAAWPVGYDDLVVTPAGVELLARTFVLEPFEDPDGEFAEVRAVDLTCEPRALEQTPTESETG